MDGTATDNKMRKATNETTATQEELYRRKIEFLLVYVFEDDFRLLMGSFLNLNYEDSITSSQNKIIIGGGDDWGNVISDFSVLRPTNRTVFKPRPK